MPIHMGVLEGISTVGRERGRVVFRGKGCVAWSGAIASKPAPTGNCVNPVGAGLLAMNDDAVFLKDSAALALL
jgi:hypothetical protein